MMTPKEKAAELVHKFMDAPKRKMSDYSVIYTPTAIVYAHFCIDEILYEFDHLAWDNDTYGNAKMKYWLQVKQELENL